MANSRTLTAANAILMIGVTGLYDTAQQLQGFQADDITDLGELAVGETVPGIDGRLSAGWVYNPVPQNVALQADSLSTDLFDQWQQAEAQQRTKYAAFGSIFLPATQKRYTMRRGFLVSVSVMPGVKKTLQGRRFSLMWESVSISAS